MGSEEDGRRSCFMHQMLLVLAVAALVRCGVIGLRWDRLSRDDDGYRLIAENLHRHGMYSRSDPRVTPQPTAYRPPLYPLVLAATSCGGRVSPLVVAVVHGVLGLLTVALVLGLGRMWGLGRASVVAALLVACDPILANQTAEVMTETLATFLAVVCLVCGTRWNPGSSWKRAFCVGLLFGLASLCRPTFFIWTGMCAGYVVVRKPRGASVVRSAALVAGCLAAMMPWAVRNYCVMGRAVLATTHGGYTVLLGNNPDFYIHLRTQPRGQVWDARGLRARLLAEGAHDGAGGHPEFAADQRCYRMARAAIREQPGMFAFASLVRMGNLWSPLPHRVDARESWRDTLLRRAVAVWYIVVFSLALVGLWRIGARLWTPPWVWGVLLTVAFTLVHAVYWSDLRMRAPLMPVVCVAAAAVFAARRDDLPADSSCK